MTKGLSVFTVAVIGGLTLSAWAAGDSETAPVATGPASAADTARVKLAIDGMTCGSCATTARIVLERVDGVFDATVWHDSASAVVLYDPARTSPETFIAKLEEMTGYIAHVVGASAKPETPRESR